MTFRTKIQVVLLALVITVESVTFAAILKSVRSQTILQGHSQLQAGSRVLDAAVDSRSLELATGVRVLAADFGLKRAIATRDEPTTRSALGNHGARLNADVAMFIDRQFDVVATIDDDARFMQNEQMLYLKSLSAVIEPSAADRSMIRIDGKVMQLVVTPVFAPQHIGWVAAGFEIDDDFAERIASLTNLSTSIIALNGNALTILASTLPEEDRISLTANGGSLLASQGAQEYRSGKYLGLSQQFAGATDDSLFAVLALPLDDVLLAYRSMRSQLVVILLTAIVLSFFAAGFLGSRISKPLYRLSQAALRISRGDYTSRVESAGGPEIERLSTAFNEMTSGIRQREERIIYQSQHDALTGLPNRASLLARLDQALLSAKRYSRQLSILTVNPRSIKEINDSLGHNIGDQLLRVVGQRLRSVARQPDTVARVGGGEFVLLLEEADLPQSIAVAERIIAAVEEKITIDQLNLSVSPSIGVVNYPEHGLESAELLRRCDIAVSAAKKLEHGAIAVYENGQDEEHLRRLALANDLRSAIAANKLHMNYQPKVALDGDRVCGVEALVRWQHDEHGFVSPDEFIPLAESVGVISDLSHFVLNAVFRQLRSWHDLDLRLTAAINLSAFDILDKTLPHKISNLLSKFRLAPDSIVLELTESAVVEDAVAASGVMQELRQMGIRMAIDDFGTGHASLAHLRTLPVDELKIDKAFVLNLASSAEDAVIVRSTIELAHNMGLKVTAEGVENAESIEVLRSFGCDVIQGYFISKPLDTEGLTSWAREKLSLRDTCIIQASDFGGAKIAPA